MDSKYKEMEDRVLREAWCLYENELTVREVAKRFKVSKSTVHKDLRERLPMIMNQLSKCVNEVLEKNKAERHIRGGEATKRKYSLKKIE